MLLGSSAGGDTPLLKFSEWLASYCETFHFPTEIGTIFKLFVVQLRTGRVLVKATSGFMNSFEEMFGFVK